jgi:hypothetical protein
MKTDTRLDQSGLQRVRETIDRMGKSIDEVISKLDEESIRRGLPDSNNFNKQNTSTNVQSSIPK